MASKAKRKNPNKPTHRVMRLARDAADVAQSPVGWHPALAVMWQHVVDTYTPELPRLTSRRVEAFVAKRLVDEHHGEIEGFVSLGDPWVVIGARTAAQSRADLIGTMIHEASHMLAGHRALDLDGSFSSVENILDHGPEWAEFMCRAIVIAEARGEYKLAGLLRGDVDAARQNWALNADVIVEALGQGLRRSAKS